jgi:hypothetical protein
MARVHHPAWRRGGSIASGGASAAASDGSGISTQEHRRATNSKSPDFVKGCANQVSSVGDGGSAALVADRRLVDRRQMRAGGHPAEGRLK